MEKVLLNEKKYGECLHFDEILENIDKYNINQIGISKNLLVGNKEYQFTDINHPVFLSNSKIFDGYLHIDSDYYNKNKEKVESFLIKYIKLVRSRINIASTSLINDNIINEISLNKNIEDVTLGSFSDQFLLDKKSFDILNNGTIKKIRTYGVEDDLKYNFDDIISYNSNRNVLGWYKYKDLIENDLDVLILDPLTIDEVEILKRLNVKKTIEIKSTDYDNILNSIKEINKVNNNLEFIIDVEDTNKFNLVLFNLDRVDFNNVFVKVKEDKFSINEYIQNEKMLYDMISPAINLSPYEKFLYAYDIVKHFKKYQENKEDKSMSRGLYKVINNNDYMVCVGYATLLKDLLTKLGINSVKYSVSVDTGFDNVNIMKSVIDEDVKTNMAHHARLLVNLKDEKYGIDGIYISDPTWDNILDKDIYTHALMTFNEVLDSGRYNYYSRNNLIELFYANNKEEFYDRVNYYMNKMIDNKSISLSEGETVEMRFVNNLVRIIKEIDEVYFNMLKEKYKVLEGFKPYLPLKIEKEDIINIITDIKDYVLLENNNKITLEKLESALKVLYTNFYGLSDEDVDKEIKKTIEDNKNNYDISFPLRYKINSDNEAEYLSEENKYDHHQR